MGGGVDHWTNDHRLKAKPEAWRNFWTFVLTSAIGCAFNNGHNNHQYPAIAIADVMAGGTHHILVSYSQHIVCCCLCIVCCSLCVVCCLLPMYRLLLVGCSLCIVCCSLCIDTNLCLCIAATTMFVLMCGDDRMQKWLINGYNLSFVDGHYMYNKHATSNSPQNQAFIRRLHRRAILRGKAPSRPCAPTSRIWPSTRTSNNRQRSPKRYAGSELSGPSTTGRNAEGWFIAYR